MVAKSVCPAPRSKHLTSLHTWYNTYIQTNINMQVKVKTLTGRDIPVDVEAGDKVIRIKEMMEEKEGIPPAQQRLIFNGSQLNDEITIQESGIQAGASLHLVLTLRGGH